MSDDVGRLRGNWNYPTAIRFGAGRVRELPEVCKAIGMRRPLLVTDPGLARLPMVQEAIAANKAAGVPTSLFSDVRPNPVLKNITDGVAVLKVGQHDGVIAMGGGAALDAGKLIAFMSRQHRPIWDFEDREDWWTRAHGDSLPPVIAVPTTSGTGSEVGRAAVVTDDTRHVKKIIFHPKMMPVTVISDPALTVGLPAKVTAAVGMDALSHALEAYFVPSFHPIADGVALEATRLVKEWLPLAVADGANLAARAHMMVAASMGATAFQKGLGAMHALSHPCSGHLDTHHGLTNGVVMPYVLAYNRPAIADKLAALSRYLGLGGDGDAVIRWVVDLRRQIGIPHTLAELGVTEAHADEFAPEAIQDPCAGGNPAPLDVAGYAALYRQAISGQLPI
jgi:alcohol dehydrogenase class IV